MGWKTNKRTQPIHSGVQRTPSIQEPTWMKYTWEGIKQISIPKIPQAARLRVGKYSTPRPNKISAIPERMLISSGMEKKEEWAEGKNRESQNGWHPLPGKNNPCCKWGTSLKIFSSYFSKAIRYKKTGSYQANLLTKSKSSVLQFS